MNPSKTEGTKETGTNCDVGPANVLAGHYAIWCNLYLHPLRCQSLLIVATVSLVPACLRSNKAADTTTCEILIQ
jgi:hypothetical protein